MYWQLKPAVTIVESGLYCDKHVENVANEDVRTQVRIFSEHKEEDAEEFSHRYDNVRFEMEYPLTALLYT